MASIRCYLRTLVLVIGLACNLQPSEAQLPERCLEPKDVGDCSVAWGKPSINYYYDQALDQCQSFMYKGCKGNNNRFYSMVQCQSTCPSTPTATEPPTPAATESPVVAAAPSTHVVDSSKCILPMDAGNCEGSEDMYYFDKDAKSCKMATFTSCPGNMNYFRSKATCEKTCAKFFLPGSPKCLKPKAPGDCDGTQDVYYFDQDTKACQFAKFSSCPGNNNNFQYKSVCETMCAPYLDETPDRDSSKCILPMDAGDCEGSLQYYYFDVVSRICKIATFSSCPGNLNYFRFKSACEKRCAYYHVRGAPKCLNPVDPGQCEGNRELFYFDAETKSCVSGNFTDCPGNLNYFKFKSVCDTTCGKYMREAGLEISSKRSVKCLLPKDEGDGSRSKEFYYFDQNTKVCLLGDFTNKPGNLNYFSRKEVCEATCAPYLNKKALKCMQPMEAGDCDGSKEYFYFDWEAKSCKSGTFTSCPGNMNYFNGRAGCEATCGAFIPAVEVD